MAHNRFQTANNHTGANGGRVSNAPTDQRRWTASSSAIGAAKTRPSRSTRSRQTGAGMIFESARAQAAAVVGNVVPFALSISKDGEVYKFKVSNSKSSIMDGTNGFAIDFASIENLFNFGQVISDTKYIALEAEIDTDREVIGWSIVALDEVDALEVRLTEETDPPADPPTVIQQDRARLIVGKIFFGEAEEGEPDPAPIAIQFVDNCQIFSDMFLNGVIVKGFTPHPFTDRIETP